MNPCLTCNFVQPTPLSFLHQLVPVMPTFFGWWNSFENKKKKKQTQTVVCVLILLWTRLFFWKKIKKNTDAGAKRRHLHFLNPTSISRLLMTCQDCLTWVDLFFYQFFFQNPGHEIIIPATRFLCVSKQKNTPFDKTLRWRSLGLCFCD